MSNMAAFTPFTLSAQLSGHSGPVRAVAFKSADVIVSTSNDKTIRMWTRSAASPPTYNSVVVGRSEQLINAVAIVPPSRTFPSGLIVSGGWDNLIQIHEPRSENDQGNAFPKAYNLHDGRCAGIAVSPMGSYFVSGGWDCVAKVVSIGDWEVEAVLIGHDAMVEGLLPIDEGKLLTGCSDHNIRRFALPNTPQKNDLPPTQSIELDHPVRALCRLPTGHASGADFASAGNDCIIRLWTFGGKQVAEMSGHENLIFSLDALPTGEIISSGEDRTLRIWKDGKCMQTIYHPEGAVWSVAACPTTGDIVSAGSDGQVRVWTRSDDRVAGAETIERYEESIRETAIAPQTLGDLAKTELPGPDFLQSRSGTQDGQIQLIRNADSRVTAHSWSSALNKWEHVGLVSGVAPSAAPPRTKIEYGGKKWDFLLPVDVDGRMFQLPYNLSDEPFTAARRFLEENNLNKGALEAVAQHIIHETAGARNSVTSIPQATQSQGTSTADSTQQAAKLIYFPAEHYMLFPSLKAEPVLSRLSLVNDRLVENGDKEFALNPSSLSTVRGFAPILEDFVANHPPMLPGRGDGLALSDYEKVSDISDAEIILVIQLAANWKYEDRLPGLDLLRCLLLLPQAVAFQHPEHGTLVDLALSSAFVVPDGASDMKPNPNLATVALRSVQNAFATEAGRRVAIGVFPRVLAIMNAIVGVGDQYPPFKGPIGLDNRNLIITVSSIGLNYSVLATTNQASDKPVIPHDGLRLLVRCLGALLQATREGAVISRILAALGTLALLSTDMLEDIKRQGAVRWALTAKDCSSDRNDIERAKELMKLLG